MASGGRAPSSARLRVNPAMPALAATYTAIGACGSTTAMEATFTMAPRVAASASTAACDIRKVVLLRHLGECGQRLLHESGAAPAEIPIERLADARDVAVAEQRAGYVGPAHGAALGLSQHIGVAHPDSEPVESLHHGPAPPFAIGAAAHQEILQRRGPGRQKIAQHVHLAPGGRNRKFAAADDPNADPLAGRDRCRHAGQGVVIGERHRGHARSRGPADHGFGWQLTVRRRRMYVEVDDRTPKIVALDHGRYPVSGAVHAGCECAKRSRS